MARSVTSLDAGRASKRSMAWTVLAVVLVLFLVVPIINPRIPMLGGAPAPAKEGSARTKADGIQAAATKSATEVGVSADFVWNAGPLASVHQKDSYNCVACHQTPFMRVRDAACLNCHEQMPGHVLNARLQSKLFGQTRCAECHPDHRGGDVPIRADAGLCVSCHEDLTRTHAEATLGNASDFLAAHPEFKLTLWRGPGPADFVRVKQSDKARIVEASNLKFPHDVHLKPGIKGPDGRENLTCTSCHTPDTSQKKFVAIDMNRDCIRCHELRFEPDVQARQVPHGSVEEAWLLIQEFYANISLGNIPVDTIDTGAIQRTIPMASDAIVTEGERQRRLKYARDKAQKVGVDLFEKRVCVVCHDVRRSGAESPSRGIAVPWTISPVRVANAWMPKARFDHEKHGRKDSDCKGCHDVSRSKRSSDVAMPDIQSCRTSGCHGGNEPTLGMVVSTCVSCHDYHLDAGHARLQPAATSTGTKQ